MTDVIKEIEHGIREICKQIDPGCDTSRVWLRMRNDPRTGEATLNTNAAFILSETKRD